MIKRKVVVVWGSSIDAEYGIGCPPLVIPRRGRNASCKVYLGTAKNVPMYAMRGIYTQTVKYKPTWKE